jgi:hypothetical protein
VSSNEKLPFSFGKICIENKTKSYNHQTDIDKIIIPIPSPWVKPGILNVSLRVNFFVYVLCMLGDTLSRDGLLDCTYALSQCVRIKTHWHKLKSKEMTLVNEWKHSNW